MKADVTLVVGISTNDTQCTKLQVQDKDIKVKEVKLRLEKMYVRSFFSFSGSTGRGVRMSPMIHKRVPSEISSVNPVV